MGILLFGPLLLILIFKLFFLFAIPYLSNKYSLELTIYYPYALSGVIVISSGMMGIVTGFLMMDERDGNISELISVTPLGHLGYLFNRLTFAAIPSAIYTLLACIILYPESLNIITVLLISAMSALYSSVLGLLIFNGADNKVKGLTFAKGLNSFALFAFSDLFNLEWLTIVSYAFPPFWITHLIKNQYSAYAAIAALLIHAAWFVLLLKRYLKRYAVR